MATTQAGRPQQVTDAEIFAAMADVITKHGPSGLSLNAVGDKLGVTGPALGYRFKNRQGLLLAFAQHQVTATADRFASIATTTPNPESAILTALTDLGSASTTRAHVANNLAMLHLDLTNDALGACAARQSRLIRDWLAAMLNEAGVPKAACDDVADEIYVAWSGASITWAIDGTGTLADWVHHRVRRVLDRALRPL